MKLSLLKSLPPRARKLVLWTAGLFLGYTLLGFLLLPLIIRAVAVKQISRQLGREASIRKVKLNPYALSATVQGLLIKDLDGQPFVAWDEVYVNLQAVSFFGHPWVFEEIRTTKPFVRVQMNKDYTLNFSDLLTKFSTNPPPSKPPKPLVVRINQLRISGATASVADFTTRTPFQRVLGPLDVTLLNFRTDPDNKNPYSIAGTTDGGEKFAWTGHFYLDPLRSQGEFSLENLSLNKYAALYQDFIRFQVRDGVADARLAYHFELGASNMVAWVTNAAFGLRSFKVAESNSGPNFVEVPDFKVTGASLDARARQAAVDSITASGARLTVRRDKDSSINVVELSKPAEAAPNAPGGVLFLLRAVTNAVTMLLASTNAWSGTIHDVRFQDCAVNLEDLANTRPVRLSLDNINFSAQHISNLPGTNLTASLSLRWNTNGTIKTDIQAAFSPTTADISLGLDHLELRALDPYLEPKLDLFVLGSKLSMDGHIRLRTTNTELPEVTFQGDVRLDDFSTVDGVMGEDLLKWGSVRLSGIDARLNPETVRIKEVAVDDAYARVIIETNQTLNLLTALRMTSTNAPGPAPEEAKPAKPQRGRKAPPLAGNTAMASSNAVAPGALPKIWISSVVISNAAMRFTDRSISPNVNVAIEQAGGTITGLSSEDTGHAELNLHAKVDRVGPVELTGLINPLNPNQTNELKVIVKNVDLTPTSPYVGKFAGYHLAQGKLNMELAYHLRGRNLKAENLIVLDRFTFGDKANSPEATKLPVRLAVAILKDREGKIKLDVPIEGSLDDPKFRLHKVIVAALVNIVTKIVTSPFAALGAVFGGKGEEISYQDFAVGSADIQPAAKDKLEALVKGLYERPGLQLEIEGSIDPAADREALQRLLFEKKLRVAKWLALPETERGQLKPEQVVVSAEERPRLIQALYAQAVARGELPALVALTNLAVASTAPAGTRPTDTVPPSTTAGRPVRSAPFQHGATALMIRTPAQVPVSQAAVAASPAPGLVAAPVAAVDAQQIEQRLVDSIPVSDSDLQALAAQRAQAVRDCILASGKVEAPRLFFAEAPAEGAKARGSRVYLQLR